MQSNRINPGRRAHRITLVTALGALLAAGAARAQAPEVKQEFVKPPADVKDVVWKVDGSVGAMFAYGNANVFNLSGGILATRQDLKNRILMEATGAYGITQLAADLDATPNGTIDNRAELQGAWQNTVAKALGRFRYDRFLSTNNTLYLQVYGGTDLLAGKMGIAGAQLGYMRQLVKTDRHDLVIELGVDWNFNYFTTKPAMGDPFVNLAAGRAFLGYALTFNDKVNFFLNAETLINFNPARIGDKDYTVAEASKVIGRTGISAKLGKGFSFRFGVNARYENAPAARPLPKNLSTAFADQVKLDESLRLANKLDIQTEAALVVSFM